MDLGSNISDGCSLSVNIFPNPEGENAMYLAEDININNPAFTRSVGQNVTQNQHQWSCPTCPMTFATVFYLREHLKTHQNIRDTQSIRNIILGSQKHHCTGCAKSYLSLTELENHMSLHIQSPSHCCKECGKSFRLAESLDVHLCSHLKFPTGCSTTKTVKTQTCNICGKSFRNASYFQLHMRMHAGDNTYTCDLCDKTFSCSWNLKTHLAVHRDEKPFICSLCGVGFKLKANMQRHERSHVLSTLPDAQKNDDVTVEKKPYSCSTCGMQFKVKANVIRHERLHLNPLVEQQGNNINAEMKISKPQPSEPELSGDYSSTVNRRHACKVCGKTYKQRCHLLSHLLSHSDARPYVCDLCGKSFSLAWNLKTHLAVHNQEKPFSCTICGSNFKLKTALQRHERSHASAKLNEKQPATGQSYEAASKTHGKELQCPGCDKKYATFNELRSHMEIHSEPECFVCDECGIEFSHLQDLNGHLESCKCLVKEFKCSVCNKKFSAALDLQIHRQMHS